MPMRRGSMPSCSRSARIPDPAINPTLVQTIASRFQASRIPAGKRQVRRVAEPSCDHHALLIEYPWDMAHRWDWSDWHRAVLVLAAGLREPDWDKAFADSGILSLRLYSGMAPAGQKIVGGLIVILLVCAEARLLRRDPGICWQGLRSLRPAAWLVLAVLGLSRLAPWGDRIAGMDRPRFSPRRGGAGTVRRHCAAASGGAGIGPTCYPAGTACFFGMTPQPAPPPTRVASPQRRRSRRELIGWKATPTWASQ